jgi:hypothetical protein
LARSVPLSRFTSRVGGGSAFFVRPLDAYETYPYYYIHFRDGGILLLRRERYAAEGLLAGIAEGFKFSRASLRDKHPARDYIGLRSAVSSQAFALGGH